MTKAENLVDQFKNQNLSPQDAKIQAIQNGGKKLEDSIGLPPFNEGVGFSDGSGIAFSDTEYFPTAYEEKNNS